MYINNNFQVSRNLNNSAPSFKGSGLSVVSLVNKERLADTFIRMTAINTQSKPNATTFPSTECQKDLAEHLYKLLKEELKLEDVCMHKDNGYVVVGTLPGNIDENIAIGVMGHYDTSEDSPGENVKAIVHKNYQGGDIFLPEEGTKISSDDLNEHVGEDIISSDGSTLLGADDKAGIAEIIEALRVFQENPELKHPTIKVAFTPDEETGEFMPHFKVENFKVDAAYTLDAKDGHYLDTETFNAINADLEVKGVKSDETFTPDYVLNLKIKGHNMHTGEAKGKLINSINIANKIIQKIHEEPVYSDNHLQIEQVKGNTSSTELRIAMQDVRANDPELSRFNDIAAEVLKTYQEQNPVYKDQIGISIEKIDDVKPSHKVPVNAINLASNIISKIPESLLPENNDGHNGFIHIDSLEGTSEKVKIKVLMRDFSMDQLKEKLAFIKEYTEDVLKYTKKAKPVYADSLEVSVNDKVLYKNPKEVIKQRPEIIHNAMAGIKRTLQEMGKGNIDPQESFIRGGTDGSTLSTLGIPTANLGAGWHNAHAKNEFTTIQKMQECTANIVNTMIEWAEKLSGE